MPTEAEVVATWPPVGPPVTLAALDLATFADASVRACADLVVDEQGPVKPSPSRSRRPLRAIEHTLDPWTWPTSSWATSVWVLPDPLQFGPRPSCGMRYYRRAHGARNGSPTRSSEHQRRPTAEGTFHLGEHDRRKVRDT